MNKKPHNSNDRKKDIKDTFGAYLLDGAKFDGYYDFPVIHVSLNEKPENMIPYSQLMSLKDVSKTICHFYEFDYRFDGRDGVWNALIQGTDFRRGFNLDKFDNLLGVVSPDYSLYMDMPRCMQIWNVYRSRTVCYYLNQCGILCIPNIRWTDEESYTFAFDSIAEGCAVSVGTLGCSKDPYDKQLFINGFKEMVNRIYPSCVIIYGPLTKEMEEILAANSIPYYHFPSQTSLAMKEIQNGNER